MPDFRVFWQDTESNDRREHSLEIRNAATAEHATWEAARQIFGPQHPSINPTQDLVRVEQLTEP